jgi:hypothetical protein
MATIVAIHRKKLMELEILPPATDAGLIELGELLGRY